MKLTSYFTIWASSGTKTGVVVWARSQLTLAAMHVTQPFYSVYGIINTLPHMH